VLPEFCAGTTVEIEAVEDGRTAAVESRREMILIETLCPWCGQRATGLAQVKDPWQETALPAWAVHCVASDCGARGPVRYGKHLDDTIGAQDAAVDAWNRGVEAAAPAISREALQEARKRVVHLWDENRDALDSKQGLELILDVLKAR
jgi:exonuclease VII small subunit